MRITLFSVEEANRLLPVIRPQVERLRAMKREFDRLETRTEVMLVATSGAAPDNPDAIELRGLSEKRRRLGENIGRGISALHEKGVLVKDLDKGLCDFYALAGDRLILLCWQLGESEVAFWHSLEDGYKGRQSLKNAGLE